MSLARVYTVKKSRKEFKCGACGQTIPKGSTVHHYAVGFRGRQQHRCGEHFPTRGERESSLVAPVWDALDIAEAELSDCETESDFETLLQDVVESLTEVAGEYEASDMYDRNEDLQQRAETLNNSASELESIGFDDEPDPEDAEAYPTEDLFLTAKDEWIQEAREKVREALEAVEVP